MRSKMNKVRNRKYQQKENCQSLNRKNKRLTKFFYFFNKQDNVGYLAIIKKKIMHDQKILRFTIVEELRF